MKYLCSWSNFKQFFASREPNIWFFVPPIDKYFIFCSRKITLILWSWSTAWGTESLWLLFSSLLWFFAASGWFWCSETLHQRRKYLIFIGKKHMKQKQLVYDYILDHVRCCSGNMWSMFLFQEAALHSQLHSPQPVCDLHAQESRCVHQRCSVVCRQKHGPLHSVNSEAAASWRSMGQKCL